MKILIKSIACK